MNIKCIIDSKAIITLLSIMLLVSITGCANDSNTLNDSKTLIENIENPEDTLASLYNLSTEESRMMAAIDTLYIAPRPIGSEEERAVYNYLRAELDAFGYRTEVQPFSFFIQSLERKNDPYMSGEEKFWDFDLNEPEGVSQNLITVKESSLQTDNKNIIIVCAHYDSAASTRGAIDNATGVAAVLEIARCLADYPSNMEVRFIFFGGEENCLFGSRYYVHSLTDAEREQIVAVINVDCIGDAQGYPTIIGTSNVQENAASQLFSGHDLALDRGAPSDYYPFAKVGIPAITIAEYPNQDIISKDKELFFADLYRVDEVKLKNAADIVLQVLIETAFVFQ